VHWAPQKATSGRFLSLADPGGRSEHPHSYPML